MKTFFSLLFVLLNTIAFGQEFSELETYEPDAEYDNIFVKKVAEDEMQSSFIIWIKKGVKEHYHADHTENIVVLEGEAVMTLGDELFMIKKGDYLNIPKGTPHSVTQVLSEEPLKVLSVQSPNFDGTDRLLVERIKHIPN
ncbi:MAG: cupin domain-containing protein [Crocinitomicaceae bacterium]|nr:cupin domain-containing protein [Crocinitomicaceae bacterium]